MKKFLLLAVAALFFGAITAARAKAQSYASRVISVCQVCHQNVYAYYQPVNYGGVIRYTWVPVYHTRCVARPVPRVVVPYSYGVPHYHNHGHSHYHRSPSYSGYLRPGFSITIRR
jgi:hypothetical protein